MKIRHLLPIPAILVSVLISCSFAPQIVVAENPLEKSKKYHWLFRDKESPPTGSSKEFTEQISANAPALEDLDREAKLARKLYLSGDDAKGFEQYSVVIKRLETLIDDIPAGHPLLFSLEQRFNIFDEFATKLLGPVHLDPPSQKTQEIFSLFERMRLVRRNLVLKKAGPISFFDVAAGLLNDENELLNRLSDSLEKPENRLTADAESAVRGSLNEIRKSMAGSSERYKTFRFGNRKTLDAFQKTVMRKEEIILDYNILPDRIVMGVITKESATYYQTGINRSDFDRTIFQLQEKLKDDTIGEEPSFMGHAWKEPSRRVYRTLFSKFPPLPAEKQQITIFPDKSLWYLPFPLLLDPEDRPFGKERFISFSPSADILALIRTESDGTHSSSKFVLFESLPWINSEDLKKSGLNQNSKAAPEQENIEKLILKSSVYPKASDMITSIQKIFKNADIFYGGAATWDKFREYRNKNVETLTLAIPFGVTDRVTPESLPVLFFSPGKHGARKFAFSDLFETRFTAKLMLVPASWFDVEDFDSVLGEGPLLSALAAIYSGKKITMVNYADPTWGKENPFLLQFLKRISSAQNIVEAFSGTPRETQGESDLSPRPPAWTGWIFMGDPY